ncbi:MAG: 5-(carboxyamino)imidazole ribonucleotide synthase [Microcoleaceae cyanobacterium]
MKLMSIPPLQPEIITSLGVIGGGQLAGMMANAAQTLGISLIVQTPHRSDPAVEWAAETILAELDDVNATTKLAERCQVITFENEFINISQLSDLSEKGVCFRPGLEALSPLLDKYDQLCYLQNLGLPTPRFELLSSNTITIPDTFNYPVVLKARRHGYDGQGTFILHSPTEFEKILDQLEATPMLVQEFIPFQRELAIIAARSVTGEVVSYPVVETYQKQQVCRSVVAPARISNDLTAQIKTMAQTLLNSLQAVGVFGIELFLTETGQVLINEIAPRTHNSGHYTLDACQTSQFAQHLRAVSGLPLADPSLHCAGAVMVNLLGYEYAEHDYKQQQQQLAGLPQTSVHWYGKSQSRPGRKLGHVTALLTSDADEKRYSEAIAITQQIESIWYGTSI